MPKIFIIGNGLDRAHGYNTSYHDFITLMKMKCVVSDDVWKRIYWNMYWVIIVKLFLIMRN